MYRRNIENNLLSALTDTPVVVLNGARQTGKTTLVKKLATALSASYVTLDDATTLSAASFDPQGFINGFKGNVIIDEIQKAPMLFPAIKISVDENRQSGRFLLTGSANVLLLPRLSESLVGRMEIITLAPLSQGEMRNRKESFIDWVFAEQSNLSDHRFDTDYVAAVLTGGFPEAVQRTSERRRNAWFSAYITALLQRDIRDLANIEGLTDMPRLLSLIAGRVGGLLNMSELSRSSGIPNTTLKRYLSLLKATYLFTPLPAWSSNPGKKVTKAPKIQLIDSGLTAFLNGQTSETLNRDPAFFGHLLESFVIGELRKQLTWAEKQVQLFHYRTLTGIEVDVVMEDRRGNLVGIEVKASATVKKKNFSGLRTLAEYYGDRFLRGIVLYTGNQTISFGPKLLALPVSALWNINAD
ncbi:MAG: ATP-binding protein [FCB group bacterium]|nr:ATP-binding protein [FCB group bacterium]